MTLPEPPDDATRWPDGEPITPWADPWRDVLGDIRSFMEHAALQPVYIPAPECPGHGPMTYNAANCWWECTDPDCWWVRSRPTGPPSHTGHDDPYRPSPPRPDWTPGSDDEQDRDR